MLNSLTDITILAPNNDALKTFLGNTSVSDISPQQIGAILSYHVLNGTYYSDNVTDTPSFLPTLLNATEFTNVTGGQVVEAIKTDNNVTFLSGFRKQSNVTQAVCGTTPCDTVECLSANTFQTEHHFHWWCDPHH
jgi:uncharacterized surface protein with fasciclin (FAS1) repeats